MIHARLRIPIRTISGLWSPHPNLDIFMSHLHLPFTVSFNQIWNGKLSEIFKKIFKKCFDLTCEYVLLILADADEDVFLQIIFFHLYIECLKLTLNIKL